MAQETIPTTQHSAQLRPNECLVKIEYAGVCQSDLLIRNGHCSIKPLLPLIGGHEGVGTVVAIGAGTVGNQINIGDRVGLKWNARTCLNCEDCRLGNELACLSQLSGCTTDGTFAEYTVSWTTHVTPIPKSLESPAATSILCADVTVYKGLKRVVSLGVAPGSWVAIVGGGGGLEHLAIQYATAMGFRVIAIDSGEEKRKLCLSVGAEKWIDFKESGDALIADVVGAADGAGLHAALVAAGSAAHFQACLYVKRTAPILFLGVPSSAPFQLPFEILVGKELKLIGSQTGSRQDVIEALSLASSGKVKCHYTLRKLEEVDTVLNELGKGEIAGRVILKV